MAELLGYGKRRTLSPCTLNSRKSRKRREEEAAEKAGSMKSRQNCPSCSETAGEGRIAPLLSHECLIFYFV
jgi:hypothetical protein